MNGGPLPQIVELPRRRRSDAERLLIAVLVSALVGFVILMAVVIIRAHR